MGSGQWAVGSGKWAVGSGQSKDGVKSSPFSGVPSGDTNSEADIPVGTPLNGLMR